MDQPIRMAGGGALKKAAVAVPFFGDLINAAIEIYNPDEPDPIQKAKNVLFVSGGGFGASYLTGGADAIPAFMEVAGNIGEKYGAPKGPKAVNDAISKAPMYNVEHYLRLAAYGGRHEPTEEILKKAGHPGGFTDFSEMFPDQSKMPTGLGTLVMPSF